MQHACRNATYVHVYEHLGVCMLVLYQAIPLMPHKVVSLCLVANRYIQRELDMALSTIAPESDKFVDKKWRIVKQRCL